MEVDEGAAALAGGEPDDQGANAPGVVPGVNRWGRSTRVGSRPLPPQTSAGVLLSRNIDVEQELPDLSDNSSFPVLGAKDSRLTAEQGWRKSFVRTRPSQDVGERESVPKKTLKERRQQNKANVKARAEALRASRECKPEPIPDPVGEGANAPAADAEMGADAMPPPAAVPVRVVPAVPLVPAGTVVSEHDEDVIARQAQAAMTYVANAEPGPA
eukprot:9309686-Alexandrium_andersonii.AAC.1